MVEWDGIFHKWFGNDNPACCLMAGVDDSNGKIVGAFFIDRESSFGYFKLLEIILQKNRIPLSIYQDRLSALKRNDKNWTLEEQLKGKQNPTQVGVVLEELDIQAKFAYTPQAKGRIERLFGVLQDRLIAVQSQT